MIKFYAVGIFADDKAKAFYDGRGYTKDLSAMKIFSEKDKSAARYEQGNHQRLNSDDEVRVIEFRVEAPFELAELEPTAALPPVPIADPTAVSLPSEAPKTTIPELSVLAT